MKVIMARKQAAVPRIASASASKSKAGFLFPIGRASRFYGCAGALILTSLLCGFSSSLRAQEPDSIPPADLLLRDTSGSPSHSQTPIIKEVKAPSFASLAGTVRDSHGRAVPGATVTIVGQENAFNRAMTADGNGVFTFAELLPGRYSVAIDTMCVGDPPVLADVVLGAGERRELPIIGTQVVMTSTTVRVVATPGEIAEAQIKQQEKQRLLGVVPNFNSSYIWDALPMSSKQKFKLVLRSNIDPVNFLLVATLAGLEQKHNTFPGYGQGAEGYGKRFGAAYADTVVSKMLSRAILPSVLHQDPRYFYRGSGTVRTRVVYALTSAIICRGDNGRLQPNYSQVLGSFAATGISNLYRGSGDRTTGMVFRNGLVMIAGTAAENLIREFVSRKLTPNVPAFANGKP